MKRYQHLTHATDFRHTKQNGKSFSNTFMVLLVAKNNLNHTRFAVAAGRAVGNAVERNYVKRRLRACIEEVTETIKPGWDLIFYARQPTLISKFSDVNLAMRNLLFEADLML